MPAETNSKAGLRNLAHHTSRCSDQCSMMKAVPGQFPEHAQLRARESFHRAHAPVPAFWLNAWGGGGRGGGGGRFRAASLPCWPARLLQGLFR